MSFLVLTGLAACAGQASPGRPPPGNPGEIVGAQSPGITLGERAARFAVAQVGRPYRFGGSTPQGFDCSGLVHYAYARAGKQVPRTTRTLWADARTVHESEMRAGDLLFFDINGKMSHVGMYLGDGRFVHAPSTGRTVSVESLHSEYYSGALLRMARPN